MLLRFFCSAYYAKRKTKTKSTKCKYYVIVVSTTWKPVFFFAMCVYIRLSRIHYMRICEALGWTLRIHSFYSYTHFCIWNTEKRECSTMKRALKQIRRANFCVQEQMQKNAYILFSLQFVTLVDFVGWNFVVVSWIEQFRYWSSIFEENEKESFFIWSRQNNIASSSLFVWVEKNKLCHFFVWFMLTPLHFTFTVAIV